METRNLEAGTWRGGVEEVEKRMGNGKQWDGNWEEGGGIKREQGRDE